MESFIKASRLLYFMVTATENNVEDAYTALVNGLNEMERLGIDRVLLSVEETESHEATAGNWILSVRLSYYPFDFLEEEEKDLMQNEKSYSAYALVRAKVGDYMTYPGAGVEKVDRTHIIPMLPKLKKESNTNYTTKTSVYTGENLKKFAMFAEESGWNFADLTEIIKQNIEKIHMDHMEKSGVYEALKKMDERKYTPFEEVIAPLLK